MRGKILITLASLLLAFSAAAGAVPDASGYRFTNLTSANSGLCYDGVSKIVQDSRGYIWIGTFSGLNRYDGTHFKLYREKELGLPSDFIHAIIEDADGNMWIGTDAGVSRYIWKDNRFEPFLVESDLGTRVRNKVTFLHCGADGRIWIVANYQGCFCYDPSDGSLVNFRDGQKRTPEYNTDELSISFRRLVEDGQGGFWVSKYHSNLFHADAGFRNISPAVISGDGDFYKGDEIEQLFLLDGTLLVASNFHGLSRYYPESGKVETLFSMPAGTDLVDATLFEGRWVWLSTTNGVWRYDLRRETPPLHLGSGYVFSTCVDREGGLWIGTKDGGVSYSGKSQSIIRKTAAYPGGSLKDAMISGFAEDGGRVWITTETKGLFCYDKAGASLTPFIPAGGKLPVGLCAPCCDGSSLWLGSLEGLYRVDTRTRQVRRYGTLRRTAGVSDPRVYVTYRSKDGNMYFANTLGLFRYDRAGDSFVQIPAFDGVFVTSMAETPDGLMWISSYATGIFVWNPINGEMVGNYRYMDGCGLPSDKISSVFVDRAGDVWAIGFSWGFARFAGGSFEVFDSSSLPSLPTEAFFCASQDAEGNLWINSDRGLFRFNPQTRALNLYSEFDGLLENKLTKSALTLSSGELMVGSNNGFVCFDPASFLPAESAPEVLVSEMYVGPSPLGGNPGLKDRIVLKARQNSFGFEFSVMSLAFPASNQLRCRLKGFEKEWQDVSVQKSVYYYNVPAGNYHLEIQACVSGNRWIQARAPLEITVKPTFFTSLPGIALVSAVLLLLFLLALRFFVRRQRESYRRKAEGDLFRDKMNFFSHVVHEIKTPLTLIKTPLQSVIDKDRLDDEARHDLMVMQSNADYLSLLVNELLEFVRIERSGYVLNMEDVDVVETLRSLVFNYSDTAEGRNIDIRMTSARPHIFVHADAPALSKILNNLLINALKYAESRIDVRVGLDSSGIVSVAVANDGETIPEKFRDDIFKPFEQYHSDGTKLHKGFGIGLPLARSLARKHSGDLVLDTSKKRTTFLLTLPHGTAALAPETMDNGLEVEEGEERPVILLADDNAQLRDFISRKLESEYTVLQAPNANSALRIMKDTNVDLLITDIAMPGKDGLELCREIRSDAEISHTSIIILSARASVESKIEAMEAGADMYMEKPFDLDYMRSSIKGILEHRKLMRDDISMLGLPKRDEEFIRAFDSCIKENMDNTELSNELLAKKLNMSQSTLIRKIRKLLNTSPSNYIRAKRLASAAVMLRNSHGNNITDICYACGFSNESYFAKCFKEQYGVTPSEYAAS